MTLAEVHDLALSTPNGRPLVRGLSFGIGEGEILAVTGPNGAGKSTLLRTLVGKHQGSSGTTKLQVPGEAVFFLPQLQSRAFHWPVRLADVLDITVGRSLTGTEAQHLDLLTPADLRLAWNAASDGERQRTLLSAALLKQPRLLVLDEPTSHLDSGGQRRLNQALATFLRLPGRAVVMACHQDALTESAFAQFQVIDLREYAAT